MYFVEEQQHSHPYYKTRSEVLEQLRREATCDFLIIGGGIQGATFAHLSALNGFKTVLLERQDYAYGTSSRSSKIAHGGLRYLSLGDLRQVYEGLKAREDLLKVAPHLTQAAEFACALGVQGTASALAMRLGARAYSWLSALAARTRGGRGNQAELGVLLGQRFMTFRDALVDDARLVIERIIAARQEGARCLNHAAVEAVLVNRDRTYTVKWRDKLGGPSQALSEIQAGVVVNCAGHWLGQVVPALNRAAGLRLIYSRGSHLLFSKPWLGPALVFPLADSLKRVYFILPHPYGTLVGTTERPLSAVEAWGEQGMQVASDEVDEILARLKRDVPPLGLDRDSLFYAFAGVRTLVARAAGEESNPALASRRPLWVNSGGVMSLAGGKYTTASLIAEEGLRMAMKLAGLKRAVFPVRGRLLPGAAGLAETRADFLKRARELGLPDELAARCIARFGGRARYFLDQEDFFEPIGPILKGELELAVTQEQAQTIEDVLSRRLGLEYSPGHGLDLAAAVAQRLGLGSAEAKSQEEHYREHIEKRTPKKFA